MYTLHVLIGIPGVGKSTYAQYLSNKLQCQVVSTDILRNENPNCSEKSIWPLAYESCAELLKNGDVIFDATNTTPIVRKRLITEVKKFGVDFIFGAYYLKASAKTCYDRIVLRNKNPKERYFPPVIVFKYANEIVEPTVEEGFTFIKIIESN